MSEERLTEAEWRRRMDARECLAHGHDWEVIETLSGPVSLFCRRDCGIGTFTIVKGE